jgi:hypothetical protein
MAKLIPLNYKWIHDDPITRPTFQHDGFTEPLEAIRCIHMIRGRQCLRRSIYTIPMCWQHLKSDYNITVDRTTLVDSNGNRASGIGLFACSKQAAEDGVPVFGPGERIVPYIGKKNSPGQMDVRYPQNAHAAYAVRLQSGDTIDAGAMRGAGALANECREENIESGSCEGNNAEIREGGPGNYPLIVAIAPIFDGEEIFITYGDEYWGGGDADADTHTVAPRNAYNRLRYKRCTR